MNGIAYAKNSYVEALTPNLMAFWDGAFGGNQVMRVESSRWDEQLHKKKEPRSLSATSGHSQKAAPASLEECPHQGTKSTSTLNLSF